MRQMIRASEFLLAGLLVIALLSPPETSAASQESRRVALVIGNNSYTGLSPLHNAVNDACSMREALQRVGFIIRTAENTSHREMDRAVRSFIASLNPGDVALLFYAGHAFQSEEGENYLMPTDFDAGSEVDAVYDSISAQRLQALMEQSGAGLRIIILDACRNNPFSLSRAGSRGLAAMNAGRGTFIAYAAGPGQTASDISRGNNGLFTAHLVDALEIPGLTIDQVFRQVGGEVFRASNGSQEPWISSSIYTDFYFIQPTEETVDEPELDEKPTLPEVSAETAVELYQSGMEAFDRGDYRRARVLFLAARNRDSALVSIIDPKLAECDARLREIAEERARQAALESERQRVPAYRLAARDHAANERWIEAQELWAKVLASYPDDPEATAEISELERRTGLLINSVGMRFKLIPAGSFRMGSNSSEANSDESPVHRVTITRPFYIGVYEVTQEQYESVMGTNPSRFRGSNRPVEQVSWNDAVEFCRRLSEIEGVTYRLPTEAEWEYACRAGTTTEYYWGSDSAGRYAWNSENSGRQTHDVGQKRPNAWGLYDMAGNVWEWCSDWYGSYGRSAQVDPRGPSSGDGRVLRGGSWADDPRNLRVSNRLGIAPGNWIDYYGFRCLRDLD